MIKELEPNLKLYIRDYFPFNYYYCLVLTQYWLFTFAKRDSIISGMELQIIKMLGIKLNEAFISINLVNIEYYFPTM